MEILDLNKLSPLRRFEQSIDGGLGKGNLGVLVSKHGIGKTACLVHLAMYKLYKGEHVVHVSFSDNVEHVVNWYKEYLNELSNNSTKGDYESILANRVVMNFSQKNLDIDRVLNSLKVLIESGSFKADTVFFDGYQLTTAAHKDVEKIKAFAKEMNIACWFSVSPVKSDSEVEFDQYGVPNTLDSNSDLVDLLIGLKFNSKVKKIVMTIVKHRGYEKEKNMKLDVMLDPSTMLISQ